MFPLHPNSILGYLVFIEYGIWIYLLAQSVSIFGISVSTQSAKMLHSSRHIFDQKNSSYVQMEWLSFGFFRFNGFLEFPIWSNEINIITTQHLIDVIIFSAVDAVRRTSSCCQLAIDVHNMSVFKKFNKLPFLSRIVTIDVDVLTSCNGHSNLFCLERKLTYFGKYFTSKRIAVLCITE